MKFRPGICWGEYEYLLSDEDKAEITYRFLERLSGRDETIRLAVLALERMAPLPDV